MVAFAGQVVPGVAAMHTVAVPEKVALVEISSATGGVQFVVVAGVAGKAIFDVTVVRPLLTLAGNVTDTVVDAMPEVESLGDTVTGAMLLPAEVFGDWTTKVCG